MNIQLALATARLERVFAPTEIVLPKKEKIVIVKTVDGKRLVRRES